MNFLINCWPHEERGASPSPKKASSIDLPSSFIDIMQFRSLSISCGVQAPFLIRGIGSSVFGIQKYARGVSLGGNGIPPVSTQTFLQSKCSLFSNKCFSKTCGMKSSQYGQSFL